MEIISVCFRSFEEQKQKRIKTKLFRFDFSGKNHSGMEFTKVRNTDIDTLSVYQVADSALCFFKNHTDMEFEKTGNNEHCSSKEQC